MKIAGVDPTTVPSEHILVLPRGNDQSIVFRATGLESMDDFYRLCPIPEPPMMLKGGRKVPDVENKDYQVAVESHANKREAYMVIRSLEPSQIEWDTVRLDKPSTWLNWENDLKTAKFSIIEIRRIHRLVLEANCLDEAKLEEARKSFLLGMQTA